MGHPTFVAGTEKIRGVTTRQLSHSPYQQQRPCIPLKPKNGLNGAPNLCCRYRENSRCHDTAALTLPVSAAKAVYPTQAKKRLEWGTHPLLPVQRKFEVSRHGSSHTPRISSKGCVSHSSQKTA